MGSSYTVTIDGAAPPNDLRVGYDGASTSSVYYAYKNDELRLSSTVRYSGAFTAPVVSAEYGVDAQTCGLWHFTEAAGSTTFFNAVVDGPSLTGTGGAVTGL